MSVIESGTVVVTVNNRLARAVAAAHARAMQLGGARSWETPTVLPFSAFVIREWGLARERKGETLPRLLSAKQSQLLWQQVVGDSDESRHGALLSTSGAATSAANARELLLRYGVSLRRSECENHLDAQGFS